MSFKFTDAHASNFNYVYRDQFNTTTNHYSTTASSPPILDNPPGVSSSWDPDLVCLEHTRTDLLGDAIKWVEAANHSEKAEIFCLVDVAGSGKTAIAHSICQLCDAKGILASNFFLNRESPARSSSDRLLINLRNDLAGISGDIGKCISEVLQREPGLASAPQSRQFERLIVEPFHRHPVEKPIVIVIDALDRSYSDNTDIDTTLLKILRDQVPKLPGTFRFFVTSRPNREVEMLSRRPHIRMKKIDVQSPGNLRDIVVYAQSHLKEMTTLSDVADDWPNPQLLQDFVQKSEGLFIWAWTVCSYLRNLTSPDKKLEKFLSRRNQPGSLAGLPVEETMDQLYQTILNRCNWEDEGFVEGYRLYMGAIVAAKSPLSSSALESLHRKDSALRVPDALRPLSSLLINIDEPSRPIRVIHASFRDFLAVRAPERFRLDDKKHSQRLALPCLEVLNHDLMIEVPGLDDMPHWKEMPEIPDDAISEELWYACRFWADHIIDIDAHILDEVLTELLKLLSAPIICWMGIVTAKGQFQRYYKVRNWIKERFPRKCDLMRTAFRHDTAYSAYRLSILLESRGRYREKLEALQEAVHIHHQLSEDTNGTDSSDNRIRAACLNNLACCLDDFGRVEEAVEVSQEGLKLHRQLAADSSAESLNDLASALNNHTSYLFCCGRQQESLDLMEDAIRIRQELSEKNPTCPDYNLTGFLANHSNHLRHMGRLEEAMGIIQTVVQINRSLAADQPGDFEPHLASSLTSLSECLADLDRKEEAVAVAREAVSLYRRMARDRPKVIDHKCAGCLNNLAVILSKSDHKAEALEINEEIIKIRRRLAEICPEVFRPDLASSLNNLAVLMSEMDREDEALVIMQESITIRRPLAIELPAISESSQDLAKSLMFLSRHLSKSGRHPEGLEAIQEAVGIWRELPARFNKELIASLMLLGECLDNLSRHEDSFAVKMEMMVLHHDLESSQDAPPVVPNAEADLEGSANATTLAELLQKLQNIFEKDGQDTQGMQAIRQAAESSGDMHIAADLRQVIHKYLSIMRQIGGFSISTALSRSMEQIVNLRNPNQKPQALTFFIARPVWVISLTTQLAQDLERSNGSCWHDDFTLKLAKRSAQLFDCEHYEQAIEGIEKAIVRNRRLARYNHAAFGPNLASCLNIRFNCLFALGRQQEALNAIKEVVDIRRRLAAERPDVFNSMLADSLQVLAHCLRHLGLDDDALLLITEVQNLHDDGPTASVINSAGDPRIVEIIETSAHLHASQPAEELTPTESMNDHETRYSPSAAQSDLLYTSDESKQPAGMVEIGDQCESLDDFFQPADAIQYSTSIAEQSHTSIESIAAIPQMTKEAINPTKPAGANPQSVEVAVQTNEPHSFSVDVGAMRPTIKLSMETTNHECATRKTWELEFPAHLHREDFLIVLFGPFAIVMFCCLISRISLNLAG